MSSLRSGPECVQVEGDFSDIDYAQFEHALDELRRSTVKTPRVDLSAVSFLTSRAIGMLVALWVDLVEQGRWFNLQASDQAWRALEKAGVARVFFQRPA